MLFKVYAGIVFFFLVFCLVTEAGVHTRYLNINLSNDGGFCPNQVFCSSDAAG